MTVLQAANYYVVPYTNLDTIQNRITKATLKKFDLWLSHWTHGKSPAQFGQTIWQYASCGTPYAVSQGWATDEGDAAGSGGAIDVDVAFVGYSAKIRRLGKNKPRKMFTVTGTG